MTWDAYAPFYDWENARTMGARDVRFWQRTVAAHDGRAVEFGCGTGRLLVPMARSGADIVGIDASSAMLARARRRVVRVSPSRRPALIQGDLRSLPFKPRTFTLAIAAYGVLQSLTSDRDLDQSLAETSRILRRGGSFIIDLVPDLPVWPTYRKSQRLRGRLHGATVTLIESVRQDRRRGLTIFDEVFVTQKRGQRRRQAFSLTFRTLPMDRLLKKLSKAGFEIRGMAGNYRGGAWHERAETWLVEAVKR